MPVARFLGRIQPNPMYLENPSKYRRADRFFQNGLSHGVETRQVSECFGLFPTDVSVYAEHPGAKK